MPAAPTPLARYWIRTFETSISRGISRSNAGTLKRFQSDSRGSKVASQPIRIRENFMHSASVWISSLTLAAAGGWFAATTIFAAPATSKEPRFAQLTMDQLDEKQKPLGEQVMKVSSVGLGGPYNPLMRSPVLGQRLFDLFYYLRWETSVPTKLNEFAILIIGRQWRSQVEWYAH